VTVHRENKVKRWNQQDATNSTLIIKLSISTCFGHHYTHHQENRTVSYCMQCSAWVCRLWLAVILWSCVVSCVHCVKVPVRLYTLRQNTACSRTQSYSCDDGHNDARNMLDRKFDNKHRISCILLVLSLHLM